MQPVMMVFEHTINFNEMIQTIRRVHDYESVLSATLFQSYNLRLVKCVMDLLVEMGCGEVLYIESSKRERGIHYQLWVKKGKGTNNTTNY